jgi:hypothetical protein
MFTSVWNSLCTEVSGMVRQASPLDAECEAEGKVVCHQGHIKGQPGGCLAMAVPLSACCHGSTTSVMMCEGSTIAKMSTRMTHDGLDMQISCIADL